MVKTREKHGIFSGCFIHATPCPGLWPIPSGSFWSYSKKTQLVRALVRLSWKSLLCDFSDKRLNVRAVAFSPGGGGGGGVLIIFLGGGVPPGPENPYPVSDQNIRFSIPYFRPDSQNAYPISDKMYTLFQTTLYGFTVYGTSWRPKRCSRFFFSLRDQCPRQHTLL